MGVLLVHQLIYGTWHCEGIPVVYKKRQILLMYLFKK